MEGGVIVFHRIKDIMSLKKYVLFGYVSRWDG